MSQCNKCKKEIDWEKTESGNWIPMNRDGSCHFDTCPYAKEFRGKHRNDNQDYIVPEKYDPNQKTLDKFK